MTLKDKLKKNLIFVPLTTLVLSLISLIFINLNSKTFPYKTYNEFLNDVNSGYIQSVSMAQGSSTLEFTDNSGNKFTTDNPNSSTLQEELLQKNITVKSSMTLPDNQRIAIIIMSVSAIASLFIYFSGQRGGNSMGSISAVNGKEFATKKYSFDSMAGNEEAKDSLSDIIDFLKCPEKYNFYGARMPKGVILYGDPGTGKTLLAKAVAGEACVPFYAVSGSDFVQMYVGVGASRIRNLFKKAKNSGKAVIFIDEIDAIGKKRGNNKNGNDERDQTLNALLTEMSGFNESDGIVVIAATNRLDVLDEALLRPGRFDRHIEVSLPDVNAREKILKLHLKNKPISDDLDIRSIAHSTSYFSGAKLESLVNEAAIMACKEDAPYITAYHFDKAFSYVLAGQEKIDKDSLKAEDMRITAYHEVGHALVSHLMVPEEKISKITIIPTSKGAGGYTLTVGDDLTYQNMNYLKRKIMVLLGGRAAEEIIFGKEKITTGAFNDLKKSTNMISSMICEYGMGTSMGLLRLSELNGISTESIGIDAFKECKDTIDSLYEETKLLLQNNESMLHSIAKQLIKEETLNENDIKTIFS